ncbi:PREDICTED: F-box protein At1g30790-like [Camelina sativa]|uniref:F-box protein At1g30790-like n=1 Tax=Camelina sativa TaxID=90675 RepID=A0ABM0X4L8_CAMSA|nr:PREDICTED: F-box protein At1g30790-like [Camelina sativa]
MVLLEGGCNENDQKDKLDPIPNDLEAEILTRLPAKSLMKLLCVSKVWSSIIRSQRFIDSHYALSSSTRSRFIVTCCNNGAFAPADFKRLFIFSSSLEVKSSSLVAKLDMTIPFDVVLYSNFKCPSIHGFLSCYSNNYQFIVCNLSTRQVITLPIKGPCASLGYDPVGRQFKALNLVSSPDRSLQFLVHEVITLGGTGEVSRSQVTTARYYPFTDGLYINGSIYYGAWDERLDPLIACFDVRYENISFIKVPRDPLFWGNSVLIDYRGTLASIFVNEFKPFQSFGLWILEDATKHEWSKQTFELPFPLVNMTSPGTNKAGEIIFAPKYLPGIGQPLFIFYYNVEKKDMRSVRLHGIADDEEFRRRYRLLHNTCVTISPDHVESIASL